MDIIDYLETIARGLKEISHTDDDRKYFRSLDEYRELHRECKTQDWHMVFAGERGHIDPMENMNTHDANEVAFFVLREAEKNNYDEEQQYLDEAKNILRPKIYSKMRQDYRDQVAPMRFFDLDNFNYELEDFEFYPMVGVLIEFQYREGINSKVVYNADDWN